MYIILLQSLTTRISGFLHFLRKQSRWFEGQVQMNDVNMRGPARWAGVLLVGCRLLVGIAFLVAGILKVGDHQGMINAMDAYEVLPDGIMSPLAYLLPILEIGAGAMLILGLFTRFAGALASALLVVFLIGLVQAKTRGLEIDCGCFATGGSGSKNVIPWWDIVRDVALLAASAYAVWRPTGPIAADNLIFKETEDEEDYDDER
jgi:uncharacterized membrane protein YphA (DoxX/SURF4 family)